MKRLYSVLPLFLLIGLVMGMSAPAQAHTLKAHLRGQAINGHKPTGQADYKANKSGTKVRFDIQIANVNLPDGTVLTVLDNTTVVGTLTLTGGNAQLHLNSAKGDTIPGMNKGDVISVDDSGGNVILSGTLN